MESSEHLCQKATVGALGTDQAQKLSFFVMCFGIILYMNHAAENYTKLSYDPENLFLQI